MIIPSFEVKSDILIRVHHFTPAAKKSDPVVVMCHPTGFCALTFASVVAHLRNLNVFAIDLRSHGYSERGDLETWDGFGKDLESAFQEIQKRTGHASFIGVGISSGSSAHILNAAKHPDLYLGLYLCEPILFPPGSDLTGRDLLAASARKRRNKFDSIDDAYNRFSQKGALSSFSPSSLALYCSHGLKADPPGVILRCNPEDEESIYLSGIANGVYDALDFVTSPCVVAFGENSTTVNREKAMAIASHLKNAKIEEIKGSGHFTLLENPFLGAQLISSFVESLNLEKLGA